MRISDWSSDVCSSDLLALALGLLADAAFGFLLPGELTRLGDRVEHEIAPDLRGQARSGHAAHRGVVVVADPDADVELAFLHPLAGQADEKQVPAVLGGAGLAVCGDRPARPHAG